MTNKEKSGQDKLMEAMRMSEVSCWEKFPRVEGEIHYSEDYLRDMEKLIKKSRNPIRRYFDTVGKRVAAAVIAAVALSGGMMSVSAVREPVVEFITNVYEKFVEIFFEDNNITKAPKTIETVYTLGIVPTGYNLDRYIITDNATYVTWLNEHKGKIVFSQGILDGNYLFDNEESSYEIIFINKTKIAYVTKNNMKFYFWNDFDYEYSLTVSEDISHETVMQLIESVTEFNQ